MILKASIGFSTLFLLVCCAAGVRAESRPVPPTSNLQLLVRKMVLNEERAWKSPSAYFEYEEVDWSPEETSVSKEIETPDGVFGRLITVNGEPPSPKRSQKEAKQLQKFVRDPEAREALLRAERQDIERRMELLKEFPNAFRFEPDGPDTGGVAHLKFQPNPNYRSSSRDALALRGAEGTLWIDKSSERLVKVEGTLVRDVTLGWGVVVRLRRGGHFLWQQTEVNPGIWEPSVFSVNVKGKVLVVKNLNLQTKETHRNFKRLPGRLDTAQAVSMLLGDRAQLQASGN